MQVCDSTCSWCARYFFKWWKYRAALGRKRLDKRSHGGEISFDAEARISRERCAD